MRLKEVILRKGFDKSLGASKTTVGCLIIHDEGGWSSCSLQKALKLARTSSDYTEICRRVPYGSELAKKLYVEP